MNIQFFDIINVLAPALTGFIGWFAGRRKQKNDFISDLQASIDLLAEKNHLQMEQIIKLREEVLKLREENAHLREEIEELNRRLENVKTITKKI
ncbi:hypothetical protein FACS1894177_07800 [Bacteroidia bacterium]|nr:hypothetical protein FACS1894177_07800 [Bacteroidia bacterium]